MASDADGNFAIAWSSFGQDGSSLGIYAQRYNSSGTAQGSEFRVSTHTHEAQRLPSIAMDADGDFVIAWESSGQESSFNAGVYAQRFNSSGTAQGSEFHVNSYTTNQQSQPSVAMDSDGDFVIAWIGEGAGDTSGIFFQQYNASGTAQGSQFLVNTYTTGTQSVPAVAMNADGEFVISWSSDGQDGDDSGVYVQLFE